MSEKHFWKLVKLANWPHKGYENPKIMYRKLLNKQESQDFRNSVDIAFDMLDKIAFNNVKGCGNDGYSDLLYHIIGLGKNTFYKCLNNINLIQKMINNSQYKESFSYCIPYDLAYPTIPKVPNVAQLIEILKKLPPNYPVYIRSKYSGETDPFLDYPLNINGISKMEKSESLNKKHVCILY